MGQILTSWPSPKYPNTITVNGIAFEAEYIWIKSMESEEGGVLKCTKSGSLVNEISFPYHAYIESSGLAFDGVYLWTIYYQPQQELWDHYVRYTTTGSQVSIFVAHRKPPYGRSRSVSWDGQYLWTDEWIQSNVTAGKYTTAGSLLSTFAMPTGWGTAGAYYNHQIWAGGGAYVYGMVIGGALVASFPAPGGSCRAVGFDGNYLWTADANTPQYIYKVDIEVVDVQPDSFGKIKGMFR